MQYVTRTKQNTSWNLLIMILWGKYIDGSFRNSDW